MYDLIIIGAGPAGSTLARLASSLLGKGPGKRAALKVLLLEARNLSRPYEGAGRVKSCGGLLAPPAQRSLARQGLTLPAAVLADPQVFAVRTLDLPARRERWYQRHYLNTRREDFDRWLYGLADGAERLDNAPVRRVDPVGGGWAVTLADGRRFEGRFVVGADGANSVVRRMLFPPLPVRRYVTIQEAFSPDVAKPQFAAFFDPGLTDYYAWGLPKDGEYLLGAALPEGPGARRRFEEFKKSLAPWGFRPGKPLRCESTLLLRPGPGIFSLRGDAAVLSRDGAGDRPHSQACLLGEAGGFVSPSFAQGISYAMDTAIALAESLAAAFSRGLSLDDPVFFETVCRGYAVKVRRLRLILLGKSAESLLLYQPVARGLIMASGLGAISSAPKPC